MAVVAKRYAQALIDTAIEKDAVTKYEEQLDTLLNITQNNQVKDILEYPGVNLRDKKELIKTLTKENFDKNVVNFFMLLIDNGRQKYFSQIVGEYKKMSDQYKNILYVELTSVDQLKEKEIEDIKNKIKNKYGSRDIRIKTIIDPSVIGGIKLKVGDTVIDGTIRAKLEGIEKVIKQK